MIISANGARYDYDNGSFKIDGISGTYHLPLGHNSPEFQESAIRHLRGVDCCYKENDGSLRKLADSLNHVTSLNYSWRALSTGAEAVERTLMLAYLYKRNAPVVYMRGAFHGKTIMSSHFNDCAKWGSSVPIVRINYMDLDNLPERFSAIIFEPVQGWAGDKATNSDMQRLRKICTDMDALMIADEIHCGLWRCGKASISAQYDPDILLLSKGLAGPIPLSVIGFKPGISDIIPVGWTSTHANNTFANNIANDMLGHLIKYSDQVDKMQSLWALSFPNANVTGLLIHIPCDNSTKSVERIYENGAIVTDHNGVIKVAPSFNMEEGCALELINTIKDAI